MTKNRLAEGLAAVNTRPAAPAPAVEVPSVAAAGLSRKPIGDRYEDRVRRATFHLDIEVLEGIDEAATRTGLSKAKIVNEAIRRYLPELQG